MTKTWTYIQYQLLVPSSITKRFDFQTTSHMHSWKNNALKRINMWKKREYLRERRESWGTWKATRQRAWEHSWTGENRWRPISVEPAALVCRRPCRILTPLESVLYLVRVRVQRFSMAPIFLQCFLWIFDRGFEEARVKHWQRMNGWWLWRRLLV